MEDTSISKIKKMSKKELKMTLILLSISEKEIVDRALSIMEEEM